ncbi:MAG TPA: hypothetical protein PKE04_04715 [Clostridia bacterium]|nr:hypothetical protein [Clostridia bacterium]
MDEQLRQELSGIAAKLAALEERVKVVFSRIDEQQQLVETVHKLALSMESMNIEQKRLRTDVDEMRAKSARRLETVISETLRLLAAAVVGAILMRLGLS